MALKLPIYLDHHATIYIGQQAEKYPVKVTKLARGIPMGAQLEFTDEATLASAYNSRVDL